MLGETDLDAYAEMGADAKAMRYVGDGQPPARPMGGRNLALAGVPDYPRGGGGAERAMTSPPPFSIRRATPGDATAVLDCLRAAFEPYRGQYTPAAFEDTVLTPGTLAQRFATMAVFLAATAEGEVVGTAWR